MLPPSTRSPQLLSPGFSAGHCGEDPVKDRRPLDREAQRVTPEASSHCEPTSGGPCAPVRAARCWILYAPFFRARANSAWAGLRARILYRPCPGGRIQGGRSGSSTSFTSFLVGRIWCCTGQKGGRVYGSGGRGGRHPRVGGYGAGLPRPCPCRARPSPALHGSRFSLLQANADRAEQESRSACRARPDRPFACKIRQKRLRLGFRGAQRTEPKPPRLASTRSGRAAVNGFVDDRRRGRQGAPACSGFHLAELPDVSCNGTNCLVVWVL